MSKLLNKPFKTFTLYALVTLLCSIPVYYFVVDAIWIEELDEHNEIVLGKIEKGLGKISLKDEELDKVLEVLKIVQPGTKLQKTAKVEKDSVYTVTVYSQREQDLHRFRVLESQVKIDEQNYRITIETNVEEVDETLLAISFVTLLFFLLLIAGFLILNRHISKKIWLPFRDTLGKLKAFELNKGENIVFKPSEIAEFEELNRELSHLIEKNIAAFHQQKNFIENASHELQTPLAILRTKTDLLLQSEDLTEKQSAIIEAVSTNLSRISRINKNLLLLAKIGNNQFSDTVNVNITGLLEESIDLLSDYLADKQMSISHECEKYELSVNPALLEVLFNNLLINAIFHGTKGDTIQIGLKGNEISFSNSGIKPLNENELFKRFSVSSSATTRSGLGLAISKEICNRYNWKLNYHFRKGRHVFTIRF